MRAFFMLSDALTGFLLAGSLVLPFLQESYSRDSLSPLPAVLLGLAFLALIPCNLRPSRRHVWIRTLTYAIGFVYVGVLLGGSSSPATQEMNKQRLQFFVPWMLLLLGNVIAYPLCVRPGIKRLQCR